MDAVRESNNWLLGHVGSFATRGLICSTCLCSTREMTPDPFGLGENRLAIVLDQ